MQVPAFGGEGRNSRFAGKPLPSIIVSEEDKE
jgi:hypothetical protein